MEKNPRKDFKRGIPIGACLTVLVLIFVAVPVQAHQAIVSLNTPELVEGNTVYATVSVENVENLDAGQFDLSFNSDVLRIVSAENGNIGETEIPVQWRSVDSKKVRIIFNLEGVTGVSGSGQLARIGFEVIGDGEGGLRISDGLLGNTDAKPINADWGVNENGSIDADFRSAGAEDTHRTTPGFESVFTLAGLTTAIYLIRREQRW